MDNLIYNSFNSYYNVLEKMGYMAYSHMEKLLVLTFYRDFVFSDYRGIISKEDYCCIEQALSCLYGSSCLIPYPDYLKSGKFELSKISRMAQRIEAIEDTTVVKSLDGSLEDSDIRLVEDTGT